MEDNFYAFDVAGCKELKTGVEVKYIGTKNKSEEYKYLKFSDLRQIAIE